MSINSVVIGKALQTKLQNNAEVRAFANSISRGEYINEDPNLAPWVGVYRGRQSYSPRTLGPKLSNWEVFPEMKVVVQAASMLSGDDCETLLDGYVEKVIDAVLADRTLGGTIDMINEFEVEYLYNELERDTMYFQTAVITFKLEVMNS